MNRYVLGTFVLVGLQSFTAVNGTTFEIPWAIRPDGFSSLEPRIVSAGDNVNFTWPGTHNVWLHSDETCDSFVRELQSTEALFYTYTPSADEVGKSIFIACNVFGHCETGLKVAIVVTEGSSFTADPPGTHEICNICPSSTDIVDNPDSSIFDSFTCGKVFSAGQDGTITKEQCKGLNSALDYIDATCGCKQPEENSGSVVLASIPCSIFFVITVMSFFIY